MSKPRILILTTKIIFQRGGSELLVENLGESLESRGFNVDIVSFPLVWETRVGLLKSVFSARLIDVNAMISGAPDLVIATRFPAYLIKHTRKVIWLFHQHRQMYELCGTEYSDTGFLEEDLALRQLIQRMDTVAFRESKAVYTISQTVSDRLKKFNDIDSTVLYPVPPNHDRYFCEASGGYVLSVGRLEKIKRVDLLIKSFLHLPPAIQCHIIGEGSQADILKKKTSDMGLSDRVIFMGRITQEELIQEYARALAVFYGPYKEDFGLSSIEGMLSRKPVITLADSGGILEFVEDGVTGYVCDKDPGEIAEKIKQLYRAPDTAMKLGETGYQRVNRLNWDYVLNTHILKQL